MAVVATAGAVLDDAALSWLLDHPGEVLGSTDGVPLAVAVPVEKTAEGRELLKGSAGVTRAGTRQFVRKLRRQVDMLAISADHVDRPSI